MINRKDKLLLVKDLCARLSHGVIVEHTSGFRGTINNIVIHQIYDENDNIEDYWCCADFFGDGDYIDIEFFKPYLFPLSNMTEDMMEELNANGFFKYHDSITNVSHLENKNGISEEIYTYIDIESISFLTEYFHSHHIDYRGLIEKGLAIDATGLGVY